MILNYRKHNPTPHIIFFHTYFYVFQWNIMLKYVFPFQLTFWIVNYLNYFNDTDNMIQNSDSFSYCDSKLYDNTIQRFTLYFFTLICMYFNMLKYVFHFN